jgi:hypothetical protein
MSELSPLTGLKQTCDSHAAMSAIAHRASTLLNFNKPRVRFNGINSSTADLA